MKCLINSVRLWKNPDHVTVTEFNSNAFTICAGQAALFDLSAWTLQAKEAMRSHAYSSWRTLVQRCPLHCWLTKEPSHCCRSFFSHDFSAEMKDAHSFKFLIQQWKTSMICLFCLFPHSLATLSAMRFVPGQWALQGECKQGSQAWFSVLALHSCLASQERLCTLCLSNGCTHSLSGRQLPPFEPDALFKFIPYQRKPGTLQLKHSWHILLEVRTSG